MVELGRVFQDVGTLPEMVTPVSDPEGGGPVLTPARYPVPTIPGVSVVMPEPPGGDFPAGPTEGGPASPRSLTGSVGCSRWCPRRRGAPSSRAAAMDQHLPWSGSSFGFPDPSSDGFVSSRW